MKRWIAMLAACTCLVGAAACGDDDNPTGPTTPTTLVFLATLAAGNEVPPVANAESTAAGTATVTITPTRDAANAITGGSAMLQFTITSLQPTSSITLAHIHTGAAGVNGGVLVNTGLSAATAIATPNGSASFVTATPVAMDAATINSIVANPAGFYFNVHTALNPGGVARGQLRAQ